MRHFVLVLLVACGGGGGGQVPVDEPCPAALADNDPCSFSGRCWHDDTFSSCNSGWCTCEAGRVACQSITHGATCGDEPIDSCSIEGNPSCTTAPTAGGCSCEEGFWTCFCACYGGQTTCEIDWCSEPPQRIEGAPCADPGRTCTDFPATGCTCRQDPGETEPHVHC
jgi:hypothetical protein